MNRPALARAHAYLAADALASLIHGVLPTVLPVWLLGGMHPDRYAALLIAEGISYLVAVPLLSPASDRYGPVRVVFAGELCFAALLAVALTLVSSGTTSMAGWLPYFIASGLIKGLLFPAQATVIQRITPTDALERMLGWESVAMTFGRLTGPTIAALALAAWSPAHALAWVTAAWLMVWLVQMFVLFELAITVEGGRTRNFSQMPVTFLDAGKDWLSDVQSGARTRFNLLTERWLLFQAAGELLFVVPAFGFGLALAIHRSEWSNSPLGWAQACCGAGMLLANLSGDHLWLY